ncbi:hypothetical protein CSIM01_08815 [Colletotrichum simmondsii]|uniref:Uncharacterized protein n=1 Tax=Colletotrichum simmondsii TaxID=703756 RepID=A0A135T8U7_9PEZI|nr:hypothetical protein CSIM01_08815 [Colletotrichum simmondsii]
MLSGLDPSPSPPICSGFPRSIPHGHRVQIWLDLTKRSDTRVSAQGCVSIRLWPRYRPTGSPISKHQLVTSDGLGVYRPRTVRQWSRWASSQPAFGDPSQSSQYRSYGRSPCPSAAAAKHPQRMAIQQPIRIFKVS